MVNYAGHPDQAFGHISFAQHGDDFMTLNLFRLLGIEKPSYLDLGAHHPFDISNTALLYARGSRGVNVEANPILFPAFLVHRPMDMNLNVGVGPKSGTKPFYMYDDKSGRNTFSAAEVKSLEGLMTVKTRVDLPIVTLDEIIQFHCGGLYPDFLSCDIEGLDYVVLAGADMSKSAPKVLCVETRRHEEMSMRIMLASKDFKFYCRMGENLFFVHKGVENGL
jgi:FkbM family methyltransferase